MADQFYIEEGYLVDDYFGYIAEAEVNLSGAFSPSFTVDIADDTGYFIPDYIADGYIVGVVEASASLSSSASVSAQGGFLQSADSTQNAAFAQSSSADRTRNVDSTLDSAFTQSSDIGKIHSTAVADLSGALSATLTAIAFKNHTAILDVSFTQTADVNLTADIDETLQNLINLSLQGDKFAGFESALSSAATQTATVNATVDSQSNLNTEFTLTADVTKIKEATADLSALASQLTAAIEFIPRQGPRPLVATFSNLTYSTGSKKFGSYSAFTGTTNKRRVEFTDDAEIAFPDNTDEWVLEFWHRFVQGTRSSIVVVGFDADDNTDINNFNLQLLQSGQDLVIFGDDSSGTGQFIGGSPVGDPLVDTFDDDGVWHHSLLLWDPSSGWKYYLDGTQLSYKASYTLKSIPSNPRLSIGEWSPNTNTDSDTLQIDELRIIKGSSAISDAGYTFSSTSQTVPTSAFTGTADTQLLMHFENNANDDDTNYVNPPLTFIGAATLSSEFTQTATANVDFTASAALNTEFTQTVDVGVIKAAAGLVASLGEINIEANRIRATDADLASNTTISCVAERIRSTTYSASANFSTNIDVGRIRLLGPYTLNGVLDTSIEITKIPFFDVTLSSEFAQTATATRIKSLSADLDTNITVDVQGNARRGITESLDAEFTQTATNVRVRFADTDFDSIATQLTAAGRIGDFFVNADVRFTQTATASVIPKFEETVTSEFGLTADVGRIRPGASAVDSAFDQTADVGKRVDVGSTQDSSATITIDAVKVIIANSSLNVAFTQTATAERTRSSDAQLSNEFAQTATANITADAVSAFSTEFVQVADVIKSVDATATLNALGNFTLTARSIRLDDIVYVIPVETRTFEILPSSRSYTIPQETRTLTVDSETRVRTVTKETRTHIVEGA